jgi:hypothetical protein
MAAASPWVNHRLLEWALVTAVLVALIAAFERQVGVVQGQAERLTVQLTLKALRDTLTLEQILRATRQPSASTQPKTVNPFTLLQDTPNFAGNAAIATVSTAPPGSWVFDPECGCIGYRLRYPQGLEPAQEADAIWFRVETINGVLSLSPQANYRWFEQVLR